MKLPQEPPESVIYGMRDSGNSSYTDMVAAYAVVRDHFNTQPEEDPFRSQMRIEVQNLTVAVRDNLWEQVPAYRERDVQNLAVEISRALGRAPLDKEQRDMDKHLLELVVIVLGAPESMSEKSCEVLAKIVSAVGERM